MMNTWTAARAGRDFRELLEATKENRAMKIRNGSEWFVVMDQDFYNWVAGINVDGVERTKQKLANGIYIIADGAKWGLEVVGDMVEVFSVRGEGEDAFYRCWSFKSEQVDYYDGGIALGDPVTSIGLHKESIKTWIEDPYIDEYIAMMADIDGTVYFADFEPYHIAHIRVDLIDKDLDCEGFLF